MGVLLRTPIQESYLIFPFLPFFHHLHFLSPFVHHFYLLLSHYIFIYCIIAYHKI
jgi:hypothetical protein